MEDIYSKLFSSLIYITDQQEFLKKVREFEDRFFDEILSDPKASNGWRRTAEGLKGQPEVHKRMELKSDRSALRMVDIFLGSASRHNACGAYLAIGDKDGPSRSAREDPRVFELAANVLGLAR